MIYIDIGIKCTKLQENIFDVLDTLLTQQHLRHFMTLFSHHHTRDDVTHSLRLSLVPEQELGSQCQQDS